MNANFSILHELKNRVKDKKERYQMMADRSLSKINSNNYL